jgi:two-component system, response regulator
LPVLNGIPQPSRGPPEAGATLWLTIPTARRPNVDRTADDVMAGPITILLVEDNPDDEALTVQALRTHTNATVEVARDGQEALDYLVNNANDLPRLVLLDLKLPNIDGLEVLRRVRADERTRRVPVVILTGYSAPNDVAAAYRSGANSYVRKPVDFDQFAEVIHHLGVYWLVVNEPPPDVRDL